MKEFSLVEIGWKNDPFELELIQRIQEYLHIPVQKIRTQDLFFLHKSFSADELEKIEKLLIDPLLHVVRPVKDWDYAVTILFKRGVTDNLGHTAKLAIEDLLHTSFRAGESIQSGKRFYLKGVEKKECELITERLLFNPLIQDSYFHEKDLTIAFSPYVTPQSQVKTYDLTKENLIDLSRKLHLALNVKEMGAIRSYLEQERVKEERKKVGLGIWPTDIELQTLAQTWSEHCYHKVFKAKIHYEGRIIDSLFKTYIRKVTEELHSDFLVSVFDDNAGIVRFHSSFDIAYKIETHNSPSALDPYGGALTGILGVDRDILGTGLGAEPLAHVYGYCFADPSTKNVPKGILHPKQIRQGVHEGVIDGGNQSGIPLMRGFEIFHPSFLGKPLVFCGTVGKIPRKIGHRESWVKEVQRGDGIVMVGGRVGKDGLHGATFSSCALSESVPSTAVQIGDPITQKKMGEMLKAARDLSLYRAITDNGAGGLSSSCGEMATMTGGLKIDLAKVPLKYEGLSAWEIFLSESQERMTLAVSEEKSKEYHGLSKRFRVESTTVGTFTDSGKLHIVDNDRTVAYLDMDFLYDGCPQMELTAEWTPPSLQEPEILIKDVKKEILALLSNATLCSKEEMIRQYDHEVKGLSVIKPLVGEMMDIPSDASVMMVDHLSFEGIVMSEAVNPFYSEIDTYHMAGSCVDLAVRRILATGGELGQIAGLDNFCWPNAFDDTMPNRAHKLAQLVRACEGLYDACKAYGVPLISGKDSMSNDSTKVSPPISVLPTLLFSVIAPISHVGNSITLDLKQPGDFIYLLGKTHEELGGSAFYRHHGYVGNRVPKVDLEQNLALYRALYSCIQECQVQSCHALGMGGIAFGLALISMAGNLGMDIEVKDSLFSESSGRFLLSATAENHKDFEHAMKDFPFICLGKVRKDQEIHLNQVVMTIDEFKEAYRW